MRLHSGLDTRQLVQILGETLIKEHQQWKPKFYKTQSTTNEMTGHERDAAVTWLLILNTKFHFTPETQGLAISLVDRFLLLVKVRPKYLHCVAICCLYIAAKTLEEDEVIPSTTDLVKDSQCGLTVAEILRMEAIILNKLSWDIKTVTCVDYLHTIHAMLMYYYPQLLDELRDMTPSKHLGEMTRKLFHCLCYHPLMVHRPVTLTLAVISLELEQITPCWLSIIYTLQQMAEVDNESLIHCRELAGRHLTAKHILPSGYTFKTNTTAVVRNMKRKVEQSEVDSDDVYASIKQLYCEDTEKITSPVRASCRSEMHRDTEVDNCLPLPTVSAN
ncbi:hypothetical protein ScPMuIL_011310 [Solemya velum]